MKVIKFEGTPEEFKAVAYIFGESSTPGGLALNGGEMKKGANGKIEPKEAIRAMLKRRHVSDGQKAVYKALADGELSYSDFLTRTGRTASELAGVLGALGRRINQTKEIHKAGLEGNVKAVINYRHDGEDLYLSLTPEAEEVLREEGYI